MQRIRAVLAPASLAPVAASGARFRVPTVNWEAVVRKSFLYSSVAAVLCGYFAADLLVASLTPWFPAAEAPRPRTLAPGERHDLLSVFAAVLPKGRPNLFSEKGLVPDNDEGGGADPSGPPVRTSLPIALVGVIILADPKKSVASVEDKGANQVVAVRAGDPIVRDTQVLEISDDRVLFLNQATNRREFVELPHDEKPLSVKRSAPVHTAAVQKTDENHYRIDRTEMARALAHPNAVIEDAHCEPVLQAGHLAGFRCNRIAPGSLYEKLGVQENDVICSLNGEGVTDEARAIQALGSLQNPATKKIQVGLQRSGGPCVTYSYDIN
jgi:general secretion pathway protein C